MNAPSRTGPRPSGVLLAALLLLATAAPAPVRAAAPAVRAALPLAAGSDEGFSIGKFMSGLNRRERVVQFCFGVMCVALFILCKKFSEHPR